MELMTALDRAMVAQMLENAAFLHSELGMSAGLLTRTWRWTQATNAGRVTAQTQRMEMLSASLMR